MKRTALQLGCLVMAILVLASFTPRHSVKNPSKQTVRVKSFSCPGSTEFQLEYVDFGWTGGSCYYNHVTEVYVVFRGSTPWTQPVEMEFEITDQTPWGTSTSTFWQTIYPGNPRVYVGQNQEQWNDNNCNGSQESDEMEYHTYSKTGQSHCL
jgi:hypothetical protein